MVVADSIEERMVSLRCRLASGEGGANVTSAAAALDAGARKLMRTAKVDDANSASSDRLSLESLFELISKPAGV
jgi:hypothetical protein